MDGRKMKLGHCSSPLFLNPVQARELLTHLVGGIDARCSHCETSAVQRANKGDERSQAVVTEDQIGKRVRLIRAGDWRANEPITHANFDLLDPERSRRGKSRALWPWCSKVDYTQPSE